MASALTLDQLRVLDAIARAGSFTAAARELRMATSAVSYAVSGLERALTLRLFDRTGHRAELTAQGRRVLEGGRRVLERAAELVELSRAFRETWEPELRIVVDGCLPMHPILAALAAFSRRELPTHVELRVDHLSGVRERFTRLRCDFMLALDLAGDERLTTRPLEPVEMRLLVHAGHPLARGRRVAREELARHVELVVEDGARPDAPGRLSLGSPHVLRLSDFGTKRLALLDAVGFGWMPLHLVRDDLASRSLVPVRLVEGHRHVFSPQLAFRRTVPLGRAAQLFLTLLDEARAESRRPRAPSAAAAPPSRRAAAGSRPIRAIPGR